MKIVPVDQSYKLKEVSLNVGCNSNTVEPLYYGHPGTLLNILIREVPLLKHELAENSLKQCRFI